MATTDSEQRADETAPALRTVEALSDGERLHVLAYLCGYCPANVLTAIRRVVTANDEAVAS